MRLRLVKEPFDNPDYVFELRHDGFRAITYLHNGEGKLVSRNLKNLRFESLKVVLATLPVRNAILDGEIVCLDERGVSQFNHLLNRKAEPILYAFDLLWLDDDDWLKIKNRSYSRAEGRHELPDIRRTAAHQAWAFRLQSASGSAVPPQHNWPAPIKNEKPVTPPNDSSVDEHEGSPIEWKILFVARADPLLHLLLRGSQGLVLVHAAQPFLVEQAHQLLRFFVRHRPHGHQHRLGAGFLQCPSQAEHSLAGLRLSQPCLARAQDNQLGALQVQGRRLIGGEDPVVGVRQRRVNTTIIFSNACTRLCNSF